MTVSLKPLAEQTLVITGGSSGIGLTTARRAARAGASVVIAARNKSALQEIVADLQAEGLKAAYCAVDMADPDAAERIGAVADAEFGGFDTWVNNAATSLYARLEEVTMAEHRRVFDVGYFGYVQASLYAADQLASRGGAIINVGSVLSERTVPVQGTYCAMKHAVMGFTEGLRMELAMDGKPISVTLIKPNGIDTPYPEHARNKMDKPARIPPVLYDPELVAEAICHAAQHPTRQLVVGGQGLLITQVGNLLPGLTDVVMEAFMGEGSQSIDTPPEPGAADNLFDPRSDGRERSNQDVFVRKTSYALQAQMHPAVTALAAAGGLAAAAAGVMARAAAKNRR